MEKLIIEARINEYAMRARNPNVPWTPQEIAADAASCREAGAAIVHFHARKGDGAPEPSAGVTLEIVRRIRDRSDVLINPTLGSVKQDLPVSKRIEMLLDDSKGPEDRPDILPVCLGSLNWDGVEPETGRLFDKDRIYLNRTSDLVTAARALMDAGIGANCVLWEVGHTRRLAAFLEAGIIAEPAYAVFHLVGGGILSGHPTTPAGLETHLAFLPRGRAEWAVMSLGASLLPLAETVIRAGGHLQIGIGDHPYDEIGAPTNAELVHAVVEVAHRLGRQVATAEEARTLLGLRSANRVEHSLASDAANHR